MSSPRYGTAEYRAELRRRALALRPAGRGKRTPKRPPVYVRTLRLRTGGWIRLELTADPATITGAGRELVDDLLRRVVDYYWKPQQRSEPPPVTGRLSVRLGTATDGKGQDDE